MSVCRRDMSNTQPWSGFTVREVSSQRCESEWRCVLNLSLNVYSILSGIRFLSLLYFKSMQILVYFYCSISHTLLLYLTPYPFKSIVSFTHLYPIPIQIIYQTTQEKTTEPPPKSPPKQQSYSPPSQHQHSNHPPESTPEKCPEEAGHIHQRQCCSAAG